MRVVERKTKPHEETSWTTSPIPFTLPAANQRTTTVKETNSEGNFSKPEYRIAASRSRTQCERLSIPHPFEKVNTLTFSQNAPKFTIGFSVLWTKFTVPLPDRSSISHFSQLQTAINTQWTSPAPDTTAANTTPVQQDNTSSPRSGLIH
jgi:hypothetical protein